MSSNKEKNIAIASGWGARIQEMRKSARLSQTDLGRLAGLGEKSSGYISEVESEKKVPGGEILFSLSRALGVSMDEIFTGRATPAHATPGFPEKQIVRATELSYRILGTLTLTPTKMGWLIATVAEMLVRGRAEEEILAEAAPMAKALAYSGSSHQPVENQIPQPGAQSPK